MALSVPRDASGAPTHEPNVVPMIDILLVLLIIFMMQVPLQRKAQDVQIPPDTRNSQSESTGASNNIVLELRGDGTYAINNEDVARSRLDARFHEIYDNRPQKILFVKSAGNRVYQDVIEAMDIARGAGVQVIGFTPPDPVGD